MGNKVGESFRVRSIGSIIEKTGVVHANIVDGVVSSGWTRVFVLTGRAIRDKKNYRFFELVPAEEEASLDHGEFFVRGLFHIAVTVNNARQARETWAAKTSV